MGYELAEREGSDLSSEMITSICSAEGIERHQLFIHSDNGGPMKGATMLATLKKLGVVPSFSRPSVSNDNAYSEALFKTLKYHPAYPNRPFDSIGEASAWVENFIDWYNNRHLHSGINFVTPASRHRGEDTLILERRRATYELARDRHPTRWSGAIRDWSAVSLVTLNSARIEQNVTQSISA